MRRWGRAIALVGAAAAVLAAGAGRLGARDAAQSRPETLTGTLSVVWVDPDRASGRPPERRLFLTTDQGAKYRLAVSDLMVAAAGGLPALRQQRVVVLGAVMSGARQPRGRSLPSSLPEIEVVSLRPATSRERLLGAPPSLAQPTGTQPWVTLLCRYFDIGTTPANFDYFQMYSNAAPFLDHYWRQQSFEALNLSGSATANWYTLPHPRAFYAVSGQDEIDITQMAADCTAGADASVNFGDYAGINIILNGSVSQSGDIVGLGGELTMTLDGVTKPWGITWNADGGHLGVLGHEMGHAMGLGHSSGPYGVVNDSDWDVMSNASLQQHTIAYHKESLGWLGTHKLDVPFGATTTVTLHSLGQPAVGFQMLKVPFGPTMFYTVEARFLSGYDAGLPGAAVVIHEVDTTRAEPAHVVDATGNGDPNDAGAMWVAGESFVDAVHGITIAVNSMGAGSFSVSVTTPAAPPAPVITDQPDDRKAVEFSEAVFEVAASNATSYQWQESADAGVNWSDLSSAFPYSGTTTAALTVSTQAAMNGRRYRARAINFGGSVTSSSAVLTVIQNGANLIQNGDFSNGANNWTAFATPDNSYITYAVVNGVMEYTRAPPPPGSSNQAVLLQSTNTPIPAESIIQATFKVGNSSSVRKRISVLIHDNDFLDLSVCTWWLPANQALTTFVITTHPTKNWTNPTISLYAATEGANGGSYLLDDVTFGVFIQSQIVPDTLCQSPSLAPQTVPDGPDVIVNGGFSGGNGAIVNGPHPNLPWIGFGTLTARVTSGVAEFIRPSSTPPSGVILQSTGQAVPINERITATLGLGNSSSVRKRVTVLLHDADFQDLTACTFWIPPGQALSPYSVRFITTTAWSNATVSVYPSTDGPEQWILMDDVTLKRTQSITVFGTYCLEPGTIR